MYDFGNTVIKERQTGRRTEAPLIFQKELIMMIKELDVPPVESRDVVMEKPIAEDLLKALGYNQIQPIHLPPGAQKDIDQKGDVFRDWFEEELLKRYEES